MKKFILSLLLFFLFSLIFYICGIIFCPSLFKKNVNYALGGYGHLYSRIHEIKSVKNVDILFLGSSHAYRGFDTRIFDSAGIHSFNLGSSSQTPMQTKFLLHEYLNSISPKTVIYQVDPSIFSSDGVESSLDLIANDNISLSTIKMCFKINNIRTYNTLIYGLYKQLFHINKNFQEKYIKEKDIYVKGGFVEREMEYYHPKKYAPQKLNINKTQLQCFDEILQYISQKGIKIIFVQTPVTTGLYNSYSNKNEFDSLIKSKKILYFNFNEFMRLGDSLYFYDADHLNQNGVKVFNSRLIEMIKNADNK